VCRSRLYYKPIIDDASELANLIQEVYLASECRYGYRKITAELQAMGVSVNHKKVLKFMKSMGIEGLYPKKKCRTSIKDKEHKVYPYLLEGIVISRPNQVWATDITYIHIGGRFIYLVAILDLYSRYVIAYSLSHSLEASFCVHTLKQALAQKQPEIFNSDQGVQFTSHDFINELLKYGIQISMDHKGRCFDNILMERLWRTFKQEALYFYRPSTLRELEEVIKKFIHWYNHKRRHQALDYKVPADLYF
jgi:putative transposase